jgi:Flp pilus assembly protein TadD
MAQAQDDAKTWLVKSSGAILGPFALEEVIQLLTSKQISLIDEVRGPNSRWMFIREHKQFSNIVQFLREQQSETKEDTGATFVGSRTITMNPDEVTTVPAGAQMPPPQSEPMAPTPPMQSRPITYAAQNDFRIQRNQASDRRWLSALVWILAIVILSGVGWYTFIQHKEAPKTLGYMDYIRLAQSQQEVGHFEQALGFFRKAESIQKLNLFHRLQMIPLLMVVEKQNVQARQMLDEIQQESQLNDKQKLEVRNQMAYSYLNEGQLPEAKKRLTELAKENPSLESAQVNLVEVSILEGRFQEALESIHSLMKTGVKEPLIFLYRSLASYRQFQDADKLDGVSEDLKRYMARYNDFQPEAALLLAATQKKNHKDEDMNQTIQNMLKIDPDLTRKHIHDPLIHHEILDWGYLGNVCELILQDAPDSALMKGLAVYCSYQNGDLQSALTQIEKARAQFASDASLLGLHVFLLIRSGRWQEAKALIQASDSSANELLISSMGWICQEQKDWTCADHSWKRMQGQNSQNLSAFAGLARVAVAQGDLDRAKDILQQGLLISAKYRPFLEIKDQIHGF